MNPLDEVIAILWAHSEREREEIEQRLRLDADRVLKPLNPPGVRIITKWK
jgi:hypothetical protein